MIIPFEALIPLLFFCFWPLQKDCVVEKNFQSHSKHPFDICSGWLQKTVLTFLESFVGIIVLETVRCDNYHDTIMIRKLFCVCYDKK